MLFIIILPLYKIERTIYETNYWNKIQNSINFIFTAIIIKKNIERILILIKYNTKKWKKWSVKIIMIIKNNIYLLKKQKQRKTK